MTLLLASASPRRCALLRQIGLPFEARPVDADETPPPGADPARAALAIARRKAAAAPASGGAWVLAADTVGDLDGRLLGKPRDAEDARAILAALSGRAHRVITALVVHSPGGRLAGDAVATEVEFAPLSPSQIAAYVATGEPIGKAAAYAIQGLGAALVREIRGDYGNVVGLPLRRTIELLDETGYPLPAHLATR